MSDTITITLDGKIKTVALDEFVRASKKMLDEFGLPATETSIRDQIDAILHNRPLNVIGVFLKDYIVVKGTPHE